MTPAAKLLSISPEDYLQGEARANQKHEYVDGRIYAMSGAKVAHNRVASRVLGALYSQLLESECEAFNSDTKVRIQSRGRTYFYYPDVQVVCESNSDDDTFQDQPIVVVEVLSESTRRIDEGEKRDSYLTIPSLHHYVLLEQDRPYARVDSRTESGTFESLIYDGIDSVIDLKPLNLQLPLRSVYDSEPSAAN